MKIDKDKGKAITGTLIFHGLLLLALALLALHTPLPLPGEQGVEVNIGTSATGLGPKAVKTSPQTMKPKTAPQPIHKLKTVSPKPKTQPPAGKQKILTQNSEKAPSLPPAKKKPAKKKLRSVQKPHKTPVKTKPAPKKTPKPKPRPKVNPKALFKLPKGQQPSGQGISTGHGDQGKTHGLQQSKLYNGQGGQGQGIAFSLGDRGAKFLDKPFTRFTEQGTVVVRIEVNPQGQVVRASVYAKGTTVVSENLRKLAVASAKKSVFSADPTAPAIQIGTITYHFILKK